MLFDNITSGVNVTQDVDQIKNEKQEVCRMSCLLYWIMPCKGNEYRITTNQNDWNDES